jgi:hypothetical protein
VIGNPPFDVGGSKVTVALPLDVAISVIAGAPGGPTGIVLDDADDAGPVPTAFVAVTDTVYAVPLARPVMVSGLVTPEVVAPPGDALAVYDVIGEPFDGGGVNATVSEPLPADTDVMVGAPGGPRGVTGEDGAEGGLLPTALVATTVNV